MKNKVTVIAIASLMILLAGSCQLGTNENKTIYSPFDQKYEERVDSIVKSLTLEEKIALLHGNSFFSSGGIEKLGITEMKYTDGPLGVREEINRDNWGAAGWTNDSATYFPAGSALGATWNPDLVLEYAVAMGEETRARDKDFILAPAINIMRTPLCGRNYEYFGEDPFHNIVMTEPFIKGVQMQDVGVCVKHFVLNNQEKNREFANILASERALREIYLPGFKAAVDAGAYSIMGAYNKFRGEFLCENQYLLYDVLKKEWGFKGFVLSDWGAVKSTMGAAMKGMDVEMEPSAIYDSFYFSQPLLKAVENGSISESVVDEKAERVVRVMLNLKKNQAERKTGAINTPEHSDVVYRVAGEAIVLLKNDNNFLPLDPQKIKSIAVIGENATRKHAKGNFGAGVKTKYEVTPLEGIQSRFGEFAEIKYAAGYKEQYYPTTETYWKHLMDIDFRPDENLVKEAVELARSSELAILILGSTREVESEGGDRKSIRLPFGQEELMKAVFEANPNSMVVFVGCGPFDIEIANQMSPSILWAWFNGSENGNALADVLAGKINPSGKLTFTFPKKLEDSPAHALGTYPGGDTVIYKEDIFVGYRWFDAKNIEPMYCFGYGMSYSTFEYSALKTDKSSYSKEESIRVELDVKNMGEYDGKETVQVYVRKKDSQIERADKELKGFKKELIKKGESKKISIEMNTSDFNYFDQNVMAWKVEPGTYEILVGASSRDIRLSAEIEVN